MQRKPIAAYVAKKLSAVVKALKELTSAGSSECLSAWDCPMPQMTGIFIYFFPFMDVSF